jgi:type IV pilus assembly protein PilX
MSERGARNDRDQLLAVQSAEAGLIDAATEIDSVTNGASARKSVFDGKSLVAFAASGCGTSGNAQGLCAPPPTATTVGATPLATVKDASNQPEWLKVDFTTTGSSAASTAFGTFTGQTFEAGGSGVQPAKVPRYVIEPITVASGDPSNPDVLYRVTVMGFGPRADIQAVLQMLYKL